VEGITELLVKWEHGDRNALDRLVPIVYDELHKLARAYLRRERPNRTLQPTALVNELYVKLAAQQKMSFQNRSQFFGLAATLMRNILVDQARRRRAAKRAGPQCRVSFSEAFGVPAEDDFDVLALDLELDDLARSYPQHGRIFELRFFGGLTIEEAAEVVGLSHATVERHWKFARAWLCKKLKS